MQKKKWNILENEVEKCTAFYVDIWYTGKTGKEERRRMQR